MLARYVSLVSCSGDVLVVEDVAVELAGQDRRDRRLADVAAAAAAVRLDDVVEAAVAVDRDEVEQLLPGERRSARTGPGRRPGRPPRSAPRSGSSPPARRSRRWCRPCVHALTHGDVLAGVPVEAPTRRGSSPLVTSLQEQTCASSGMPGLAAPRDAGRIRSSGLAGSSMPLETIGRRMPYAEASPTRMPPSSASPSVA